MILRAFTSATQQFEEEQAVVLPDGSEFDAEARFFGGFALTAPADEAIGS